MNNSITSSANLLIYIFLRANNIITRKLMMRNGYCAFAVGVHLFLSVYTIN